MKKELYEIAIDACIDVYGKYVKIGTTEFYSSYATFEDEYVQVLAIAGTNEIADNFKNLNIFWSKDGVKVGAWEAAHEIKKLFKRDKRYRLMVTGHSKGGLEAIAWKKLFGADWCIVFAPARGLRYWTNRKMENITIFIDPDDPVSVLGFINFGYPKCEVIKAKDDHLFFFLKDHFLIHWKEFIEKY